MEVYIAHTPYHVILSILNGCIERQGVVILLDRAGELSWYSSKEIADLFRGNFIYLDVSAKGFFKKIKNTNPAISRIVRSEIYNLVRKIADLNTKRIYVFNDSIPELQCVISEFPALHITYIEDGSAPYNSHRIKSRFSGPIQKILFGSKYETVDVLGTADFINDSLFTFPELVRVENKVKPFSSINASECSQFYLSKFADLFASFTDDLQSSNDIALYIMPPYKDVCVLEKYLALIDINKNDGITPVIKSHPLVPSVTNLSFEAREIAGFVATEILILSVENIKHIYGYPSTSLLATKYLRPSVSVSCLVSSRIPRDIFFENNLHHVGVEIVNAEPL